MGYRLSLAAVVAAALFAVAWVLCDQLADLGVGGSSAAAGVLAIVVLGLTARVMRPERPRVQHLRSAEDRNDARGSQGSWACLAVPNVRYRGMCVRRFSLCCGDRRRCRMGGRRGQ